MLAVFGEQIADQFDTDRALAWILAGVFLAAGIGVGVLAIVNLESRELVWALAFGNIAAGLAGWLVFTGWAGDFDTGGRWILSAAANSFILVGLLEALALRRTPAREE